MYSQQKLELLTRYNGIVYISVDTLIIYTQQQKSANVAVSKQINQEIQTIKSRTMS